MIKVYDNVLAKNEQHELANFLLTGNWQFGSCSSNDGQYRYWCRHFAGIVYDGAGEYDPRIIEQQLKSVPPIERIWTLLRGNYLQGHILMRCYANGYAFGAEGNIHVDIVDTMGRDCRTALYYPHLTWNPEWGGETLFFNAARDDVVAAIYPKPGRLVIFDSTIPHVARPITRKCHDLRVTLMFKTQSQ